MQTHFVVRLLLVLALSSAVHAQGVPGDPELEYRFVRLPAPAQAVRIEMVVARPSSGHLDLAVAESWGGVPNGGEDLHDVRAFDPAGKSLEVERLATHRWRVHHKSNQPLRVTYELRANPHQNSEDPSVSRRPILNERLFHFIGQLGLLYPEDRSMTETRRLSFTWEGFERDAWAVMSSFGPGAQKRVVEASLSEALSSLYVAGELDVYHHELEGGPLYVTIQGDRWRFDPEELAHITAEIVTAEREFFDDHEREFYWVSIIPVGPETRSSDMGGTGLHDCFATFLPPDAELNLETGAGKGLLLLLAHEMFHEWNGRIIQREDPEELVYWFSEGFTEFYARRILVRSGWLSREEFAKDLNRSLAAHYRSPARHVTNEAIREGFWNSHAVSKVPYERGNLVALRLDKTIRAHSKGQQSLDDLMRQLVREARGGKRVSTAGLLETIESYTDAATREEIRAMVVDGDLPELPGDLLAPCLLLETIDLPAYELGFDIEATRTERSIRGVLEGSKAHAAGLRNGQKLLGWSIYQGRTDKRVELTVEEEGQPKLISYFPHGKPMRVPQLKATNTATNCRF